MSIHPPELAEALDGLADPILVLAQGGNVVFANRAARRELGEVEGIGLADGEAGQGFRLYLARCLGSAQPLVGGLILRRGTSPARFQCFGSRLAIGGEPHAMIRLRRGADPRFAALNAKIRELNAEIRRRRESEAALAAAVAERDLLLRELQHRVKNNLHMLVGLLRSAAREAPGPEAEAALREVSQRVSAVAAGQQLLYQLDRFDSVQAPMFVETIARTAMALDDARRPLELDIAPIEIANDRATPLALIVNELVTNAVKHGGAADGAGRVRVALLRRAGELELVVADDGRGFEWTAPAVRRASGLGLVQGLAAQLGGALSVGRGEAGWGARCTVRFPETPVRPSQGAAA